MHPDKLLFTMATYYELTVAKKTTETKDAVSIYFDTFPKEEFRYKPGQYITIRVNIDGKKYNRSYSLSSSPTLDKFLRITVKAIPNGVVSNYIKDKLQEGDKLLVLPPLGNFFVEPKPNNKKHYIFIVGGSGITPAFSMIREILYYEKKSFVSLLYSNRTVKDIIFRKELIELEDKYKNFKVYHILTREGTPRFEEEKAVEYIKLLQQDSNISEKHYYLCGPAGKIENGIKALKQLNVDKDFINVEFYTSPFEKATEEPDEIKSVETTDLIVHLDGNKYKLKAVSGKSLLDTILDEGLDPPYACQEGICATCRAKLLKGKVKTNVQEGLTEDERNEGYILTCQAFPENEPIEIEFQ